VGDAGPPWILLDRTHRQLLRLAYGPGFQDPKLGAVKIMEGNAALKIHDAIPNAKGGLLLATDKGLRRLDVASGKVEPSPLPVPDRPVTALARDGLGRVWMGGDGLWVVDADGKRLHDCGPLPMIGRTEVVTIAADPDHRDGVIASLGERGVVFVRVSEGAAR
jgi:ligand-binding sensor domain-containing protein